MASVLAAGTANAVDAYGQTPMLAQIGPTYLSPNMRSLFETDWGFHAGVAGLIAESALIGMPSADLDFRYGSGKGSQLTAFATSYAERALISDRWWAGFGLGAEYLRLKVTTQPPAGSTGPATVEDARKWTIGGKLMLGFLITDRFFVEATYHRSPKVLGIDTSSASIGLGYWF